MACNIQRNQSGDIISATTNTGEESVLFNQLDNLSDSKEVAATLYAVTETAEFKKWFGDSTYLNNVGEPALRGEFYTNSEGETWWAKSTNIQDAKTKFPFGLNRVAGLTARQVNDIANFTYAFLLRKTDSVEATEKIDLKDVKKIIAGLKNSYTKIGDVETLKVLSILEEDLLDKIEKLRLDSNAGKITGDQFMDKFFPLWKELKGLYESVVEEDLNEARSINKIQNEWTKVTNAMKATAAEWKAAEGDAKIKLLDTLKQMTAQKKALEAELEAVVSDKDKDLELAMESLEINEGFEVHYSDGVRAMKKFGSEKQAMDFAKDLIKNKKS